MFLSKKPEIKCSDCGKTAKVPFKPTAGKLVYCSECLAQHSTKRPENRTESSSNEKQAWSRRRKNWKQ